jgi:hypothetical protein
LGVTNDSEIIKFFAGISFAQHYFDEHRSGTLTWCTTSEEEQFKCKNFSLALEREKALFDDDYFVLDCTKGYDTDECIKMIDMEKANIMSLDSGEVFVAGRYFSLVPIMQEKLDDDTAIYYSVAVIKKDTLYDVHHLRDLRGKKACFPYVGSQGGWNIPIYTVRCLYFLELIFDD